MSVYFHKCKENFCDIPTHALSFLRDKEKTPFRIQSLIATLSYRSNEAIFILGREEVIKLGSDNELLKKISPAVFIVILEILRRLVTSSLRLAIFCQAPSQSENPEPEQFYSQTWRYLLFRLSLKRHIEDKCCEQSSHNSD